MPKVYIVILNWRGWKDTISCLDSLTELDYSNFNILVVDNGSNDDSVERIQKAHPKVTVIETGENLGFSGGCNVGIRRALAEDADFVWLLNNDTKVDQKALSAMVDLIESNDRLGAVGSVLYYMDSPNEVQAWGGGWVSFWSGRAGHHNAPMPDEKLHYLTAASVLIKREAFEEIGLLDDNSFFMYWEDTDFSFRLRKAGWKLGVADKSIVFHKESASIDKGSPLLDKYFSESTVRFFHRHAPIVAWSIFISLIARLAKRIIKLNFHGLVAVLRGTCSGFARREGNIDD